MDPRSAAARLPAPRRTLDVPVLVRRTHELLAAGVPLTLLLDLVEEKGPRSAEHYAAEGGDAGWVAR